MIYRIVENKIYQIKTSVERLILSLMIAMLILLCLPMHAAYSAEPGISAWSDLQNAIDDAEDGDMVVLSGNVTADASDTALVIPDGMILTLDLNGFIIDRNLKTYKGPAGAAIQVPSGAILTIIDSGETSTGVITGGNSSDGGGIRNSGTLIMKGGHITGNTAATAGGGIVNYGVLVVTGGKVTGNTSGKWGGGIYNSAEAYLTVDTNTVFGNSAPREEDIRNSGSMKTVGGDTVNYAVIMDYLDLLAVLPALVLLLSLFFAVYIDKYLDKQQKRIMYIICALVFTLIIQNYLENRLSLDPGGTLARTLTAIYGYAVRPVILTMFLNLIRPGRSYRPVWILTGINAAIYMTALFSPLAFSVAHGYYEEGPLGQTCLIVSALLLAYLFYLSVRVFHPRQHRETWIPIVVTVLIGASVALDYTIEYHNQPVSFLTIAIAISCVFYYVWLHLQFVREHEDALLAEQRIRIMISQIQPHFLFNTLSTIQALCETDPSAAKGMVEKFGVYLRQNIDSLNQTNLIPVQKEIEHTQIYADIEKERFENIEVTYDVQDTDFSVPALTIQPLVENAIRHGIRICDHGTVNISVRNRDEYHEIVVKDNGQGFDTERLTEMEGDHIGIRNVRERIEEMCGGTVYVDSRIGEGTTVTIRIPAAG